MATLTMIVAIHWHEIDPLASAIQLSSSTIFWLISSGSLSSLRSSQKLRTWHLSFQRSLFFLLDVLDVLHLGWWRFQFDFFTAMRLVWVGWRFQFGFEVRCGWFEMVGISVWFWIWEWLVCSGPGYSLICGWNFQSHSVLLSVLGLLYGDIYSCLLALYIYIYFVYVNSNLYFYVL